MSALDTYIEGATVGVNVAAVAAAIGSLAAVAGAVGVHLVAERLGAAAMGRIPGRRATSEQPSEPALEERLEQLSSQMASSAKLLTLVRVEMDLRRKEVDRLQREQQQAEATRSLTHDQLAAVRDQLAEVIRPETNRGIRWSILIGVLGFVAGVLAAVAVALFVHP